MMRGRNPCQLYMHGKVKKKENLEDKIYNFVLLYVSLALLVHCHSDGFKHLESFYLILAEPTMYTEAADMSFS